MLADKVLAVREALCSQSFALDPFIQDLYVIADTIIKCTEKQFVLPSGVTVNVIPSFWQEVVALAEATSQTSEAHLQALKAIQTHAAKHIELKQVADSSILGKQLPIQTPLPTSAAPLSPKKKSFKRAGGAHESELDVSCIRFCFVSPTLCLLSFLLLNHYWAG